MTDTVPAEGGGIDSTVIIYGLLADFGMIVPVTLYLLLNDEESYAQYHQTYINMLAASYGPLSLTWMIVAFADSTMAREALTGAIEMAGLGPFALLWVGLLSFVMSTSSAGVLTESINMIFAGTYAAINLILLVAHWKLSPVIYEWSKTTSPNKGVNAEAEQAANEIVSPVDNGMNIDLSF